MGCDKELKDLDYNNFDDAKEIVLRFRDEYLHGNIEELANFSFWDIAGTKYDCSGNDFDGDRTKIVYAIDKLLYIDSNIPEFLIGDRYNYSGDTINTFNTLFCKDRKSAENKFSFTPSEIEIKNEFFRTYQKIGNFYLLPCKTISTGKKNRSLNTYRNDEWFDYFDLFLVELKNRLPLKEILNKNNDFQTLLNKNDFFFDAKMDFDTFLKIFHLEDYKALSFNHISGEKLVHWWSKNLTAAEYKKFAFDYIAKATELINKRSLKLVEVLKTKYPELKN